MTPTEINDLRIRVRAGERVPPEELAAALRVLRGSRIAASVTSTASRKSKAKQTPEEAAAELEAMLESAGL
jgi:UDP:flavonoid glycosyltransferase YjiC (YdhE family)